MSDSSEFLHKENCPSCGSRDNLARYSDGHGFCFGCEHFEPGEGSPTPHPKGNRLSDDLIPVGEIGAIAARKLTEETCQKWGYSISKLGGQTVQVANYRDATNRIVGQKVRFANKDFRFLGDIKESGLYGQHLWRDAGKRIIITEGEIDALSVSQIQGNKWPVVSVPNGANGAAKAISRSLDWLLKFEEIILMFDSDEPGQEAAAECAYLFPPGRCKVARLPLKDASDMLKAGRSSEVVDAIFGAKAFRPDGIVTVSDMRERVLTPTVVGLPWYIEGLTKLTYGRRLGEIVGIGAGTGVGKTDLLTEQIQYDLVTLQEKVGVFALEQHPAETIKRVAGKQAGKRFHVPDGSWSPADLLAAVDALEAHHGLFMYDSFGATDWTIIQNTIRFLAHSEGVRLFYLDHLTALAAAEDDERTALERIMAEMASLAKELNVWIGFVSHLATPDGKPHEEGGRVMIRHFKGSRAIGFWSHFMIGLERDQQAEDPIVRVTTTLRVLKDRLTGQSVGETLSLRYNREYGRLLEVEGDDAFAQETDDVPF